MNKNETPKEYLKIVLETERTEPFKTLGIESHQDVQDLTEVLLNIVKEAETTANQSTEHYATVQFVMDSMIASSYFYRLLHYYALKKGNVNRLEVYSALGDMFSQILVICVLFDISFISLLKETIERIQ